MYKDFLGNFIGTHRIGSYPLCIAIAETIFYLPNFFRMRVVMNPTSFNSAIVDSLKTNIEQYVGDSRVFPMKVPKLNYFYRGVMTTALPYTVTNWSIRIALFRKLQPLWEGKDILVSTGANFASGFV